MAVPVFGGQDRLSPAIRKEAWGRCGWGTWITGSATARRVWARSSARASSQHGARTALDRARFVDRDMKTADDMLPSRSRDRSGSDAIRPARREAHHLSRLERSAIRQSIRSTTTTAWCEDGRENDRMLRLSCAGGCNIAPAVPVERLRSQSGRPEIGARPWPRRSKAGSSTARRRIT